LKFVLVWLRLVACVVCGAWLAASVSASALRQRFAFDNKKGNKRFDYWGCRLPGA
jgi:hypothetical protein